MKTVDYPCEHGYYGICTQCVREERDESRRMLDDARAQEPVAYLHNKRVDVIHTSVKSLLSDFAVNSGPESMLRPIDKQEHYTIPLYASPVPPAAVPDDATCEALIESSDMRWNGDVYVGDGHDLMNLVRAAMLAASKQQEQK